MRNIYYLLYYIILLLKKIKIILENYIKLINITYNEIINFTPNENNIENDQFIYINNNSLSKEFCIEIIKRFEESDKKVPGVSASGLNKNIKNTSDLYISKIPEWKDIDEKLCNIMSEAIQIYLLKHIKTNENKIISYVLGNLELINSNDNTKNITDFGYQIQKYEKNKGHYNSWHSDFSIDSHRLRYITFIWYLNDIEEGGKTEFLYGKIKPTAGKLVLFPATWTYLHKGEMPISDDKYIITGWIGVHIYQP